MTDTTPNLTIPGPAVAELRVRVDPLNKVLAELVGRITSPDSETAGVLRVAWEHGQAVAETVGGQGELGRRSDDHEETWNTLVRRFKQSREGPPIHDQQPSDSSR